MKSNLKNIYKLFLIVTVFVASSSLHAQRKSAYDTNPVKSTTEKTSSKEVVTDSKKANSKATKTKTEAKVEKTNTYNLPIEIVNEGDNSGIYGISKPSQRRDNILVDDSYDSTAKPLPYTELHASDALFRVRVWRMIDTRTKQNAPYFFNRAIDGDDNKRLINILLKGIHDDSVQAFSGEDDRFTTPISFNEVLASFGGGKDTSAKYDLDGNIVGYQVRNRSLDADSIYKFRIKEEWIFNKRDGKTYTRILGIAPVSAYTTSDGYSVANSERPLFWVYYPDLRKTLVRNSIVKPLDLAGSLTWEEVFENRLFESQIMKSSLDAENGFTKYPLTAEQSREIQTQLNGLSKRMWNQ